MAGAEHLFLRAREMTPPGGCSGRAEQLIPCNKTGDAWASKAWITCVPQMCSDAAFSQCPRASERGNYHSGHTFTTGSSSCGKTCLSVGVSSTGVQKKKL